MSPIKETPAGDKNFGRSNVLNNEKPRENKDGTIHHAITTRHENRW